uniref:Secreted protein n=1 Tax=Steinernema glaseri TaxID=37863 RepID=A0A1I7ZBZ6_9BILA
MHHKASQLAGGATRELCRWWVQVLLQRTYPEPQSDKPRKPYCAHAEQGHGRAYRVPTQVQKRQTKNHEHWIYSWSVSWAAFVLPFCCYGHLMLLTCSKRRQVFPGANHNILTCDYHP